MHSKTSYRLALAATLALILYGSLTPLRFHARPLPSDALAALLAAWPTQVSRRIAADMVLNILAYVPLGFFAYAALKRRRAWLAAGGALGLATLLSSGIEMAQWFNPHRNCSLLDVAMNMAGGALGIGLATVAMGPLERSFPRLPLDAAACFGLWTAWQVCPFMPAPSLHVLQAKLRVLAGTPFSLADGVVAAAGTLALGAILEALAGGRRAPWLLACALCLIPARMLIHGRTTTWAELAGAAAGWALWTVVSKLPRRHALVAAVLAGAILFAGLRAPSPHGAPPGPPAPFFWLPFEPLIAARLDTTPAILLGKLFWYGAAVWLLRSAGWRYRTAGLSMAALLAAVEAAQTRIPGRTPEITDPLLALLMAGTLYAFQARGGPPTRARRVRQVTLD